MKEAKQFYEHLYSNKDEQLSDINLCQELAGFDVQILTKKESDAIEGFITLKEAAVTLKSMSNNKSPGSDGFSAEFFKVFWKVLGQFIVRSINYGFQNGDLSVTQKEGIITCIPKDNKPRRFLTNYRPISLLNTVYKIASGAIANRIKHTLQKLIHTDQTGFISGRYLGENIRLIYDIMHYTEEQNIPGLLLLIYFEKAFDSVSWSFIYETLKYFGFGTSIIQWIKLFSKNAKLAVNQGSNLSDFFLHR